MLDRAEVKVYMGNVAKDALWRYLGKRKDRRAVARRRRSMHGGVRANDMLGIAALPDKRQHLYQKAVGHFRERSMAAIEADKAGARNGPGRITAIAPCGYYRIAVAEH